MYISILGYFMSSVHLKYDIQFPLKNKNERAKNNTSNITVLDIFLIWQNNAGGTGRKKVGKLEQWYKYQVALISSHVP